MTYMKAGYQGKKDAMRDKAMKLLNHPGEAKDVYFSSSCADDEKMRKYKAGGVVKDKDPDHIESQGQAPQKYAMGGVAKIRHEEATAEGLPRRMIRRNYNKKVK